MDNFSPNFTSRASSYVPPEQKKQRTMLIVLVIVIIAIGLVVYFGFFFTPAANITSDLSKLNPLGNGGQITSLANVNLDFTIFDDPTFKSLQSFAQKLDISGPKGRPNPFIPY